MCTGKTSGKNGSSVILYDMIKLKVEKVVRKSDQAIIVKFSLVLKTGVVIYQVIISMYASQIKYIEEEKKDVCIYIYIYKYVYNFKYLYIIVTIITLF